VRRLALLPLLFAGCGTDGWTFTSTSRAEAMREGCVGSALDLLQELADRLAPLAEAGDDEALLALAGVCGVELRLGALEGGAHVLDFQADDLRGGAVTVRAEIAPRPGGASVFATADGPRVRAEAFLELDRDPDGGVRARGTLQGTYDGCDVDAAFEDLWARTVADLPERPLGVLIVEGSIDLDVFGAGAPVSGTAAFTGRDAFVLLTVDGVASLGPVQLRAAP